MKENSQLRNEMDDVIDKQIKLNSPPETKITFDRLMSEGFSEIETRRLIGSCILVEMYTIVKEQKPFNEKRYVSTLKNLPKEPFD